MIGVYVHNRGRGHLNRVLPVVNALLERGEKVTLLVGGPLGRAQRPPGTRVFHLPWEHRPPPTGMPDHDGEEIPLPARRSVVGWLDRVRPSALWVDSSPAIALAAKMTDTPMVSTMPPGGRDDEPHRLSCGISDRLIGAWPPGVHDATLIGANYRVAEVGGISRFERRDREQRRRRPRVVHLNGAGDHGDHRFWRAVRRITEKHHVADWVDLGGPDGPWSDDPWEHLTSADVVVTGAGQSSVADAACADVPVVVVPERDPRGEYDATAEALAPIPGVVVMRYGAGPTAVARVVRDQVERSRDEAAAGIRAWWGIDGATARAAEVIRSAARRRLPE